MATKEYVQYGKLMIILQVVILLFCIAMVFIIGVNDLIPLGIAILVVATFTLTMLTFYKMTITIDETSLSFRLGIGLIRKSYLLSDIQSCTPMKNPFLAGIGVHMTSGGWLYNVAGSHSIQIRFKANTNVVMLGTDKPDEIASEVTSRIGNLHASSYFETSKKSNFNFFMIFIALIVVAAISMVSYGSRETKYSLTGDGVTISGMYGMTVAFRDIVETDTLMEMPAIRTKTNGYDVGKVMKGHFRLRDGSNVLLFIQNDLSPYIVLKTSSATIYLNSKNPKQTREVFNRIKQH